MFWHHFKGINLFSYTGRDGIFPGERGLVQRIRIGSRLVFLYRTAAQDYNNGDKKQFDHFLLIYLLQMYYDLDAELPNKSINEVNPPLILKFYRPLPPDGKIKFC